MNRTEYISRLKSCLSSLSDDERNAAVSFYEEFFDEAGAENEQSVIAELGSPEKLAKSILSSQSREQTVDMGDRPAESPPAAKQEKKAESGGSNTVEVVLITIFLIIGLPIIIPVLLGIAAAVAGILGTGVALLILGIGTLFSSATVGALFIFCGLLILGIGLFLLVPCVLLFFKGIPAAVRGISGLLKGKQVA